MKKICYLLLLSVLFTACKSKSHSSTTDSSSTQTDNALLKKLGPSINGVWIKKGFIDKITQTQSVLAALNEAQGITALGISTQHLSGDSTMVAVGWDNHDSSDIPLHFKPGSKPESIKLGDWDLHLQINNADTTLVLYWQSEKGKQQIITFIKTPVANKDGALGDGLSYLINKQLVAGRYKLIYPVNNQNEINFTSDGKVSGLPGFAKYSVANHLNSDAMTNLDEFYFEPAPTNSNRLTYKFNKDTLSIFNALPNTDSTLLTVGTLKYKMIKQH